MHQGKMIRSFFRPLKRILLPSSWVLMYHHVGERSFDPWDLTVTPRVFEKQIIWLKKHRKISSLDAMVNGLKHNRLIKHSVAVTFDDGYLDNYEIALPILEKYEVPACFFIPTRNIMEQRSFWWDELESIILKSPHLPNRFSLAIDGRTISYELNNESDLSEILVRDLILWHYPQKPLSRRAILYQLIHEAMLPLSYEGQKEVINQIRNWYGRSIISATPRIMTPGIIGVLGQHPLITIGAHTVTHCALGKRDDAGQIAELEESKIALAQITGKPVNIIAYPYGSYNLQTPGLAEAAGYLAGVTTQQIPFEKAASPYMAGRLHVGNDMSFVRQM